MAILKCKMCGGNPERVRGQSFAKCEFCGSVQTASAADSERKLSLFVNRKEKGEINHV